MKNSRSLPKLEDFQVYNPTLEALTRGMDKEYEPLDSLSRSQWVMSWICRCVAAGIMIETLFFEFTGAPESVYIFSKMNMEAWWRYGQGIWELIAALLLFSPRYGWAGGILTLGAMGAAIVSHLTVLGIEIQGDHGLLFAMAVVTFISGFVVTFIHRHAIPDYISMSN